eukprot:Lankesteria_metandrocarpae@DN10382_c0_g1_i1.p1
MNDVERPKAPQIISKPLRESPIASSSFCGIGLSSSNKRARYPWTPIHSSIKAPRPRTGVESFVKPKELTNRALSDVSTAHTTAAFEQDDRSAMHSLAIGLARLDQDNMSCGGSVLDGEDIPVRDKPKIEGAAPTCTCCLFSEVFA